MASGIFLSIPSSHTTSLLELLIYFNLIDIFFFKCIMNMFAWTEKLCTECNLLNKKLISSYTNFNNIQSEKSKFGPMVLRIKQNLMIKQAHEMRTRPFLSLALFVRGKGWYQVPLQSVKQPLVVRQWVPGINQRVGELDKRLKDQTKPKLPYMMD